MTYDDLKAAISDWLARSDIGDPTLDLIIDLTEARVYRELRLRAMEQVYFRTLDSEFKVPVPSDYRQFQQVFLYRGTGPDDTLPDLANTLVAELTMTGGQSLAKDIGADQRTPTRLARIGTNFYLAGKPTGTFAIGGIYYRTLPALAADNQSNWLTDNAPDLLLWAGLSQAALYIKNYEQAKEYAGLYDSVLESLEDEERRETRSGGRVITRSGIRGA